jgi:heme-degrading monooxygenase HmoA
MIARIWRGWVRTEDVAEYVAYIEDTGIAEYTKTPGNRGAQMLTRDLGDGRSEVLTLSWWDSLETIAGFAGEDIDVAKYYPEDERFLVDREDRVQHFEVASSAEPPG